MPEKTIKKQNLEPDKSQKNIEIKDGKIAIPEFEYKKAGEKSKTKYVARSIDLPDTHGEIVRIYLDKDGTICTKDSQENELILGEFELPLPQYEEVEEVGKDGKETGKNKQQLKAVDWKNVKIETKAIPERS